LITAPIATTNFNDLFFITPFYIVVFVLNQERTKGSMFAAINWILNVFFIQFFATLLALPTALFGINSDIGGEEIDADANADADFDADIDSTANVDAVNYFSTIYSSGTFLLLLLEISLFLL
jgi:hypothetical protein